MVSERLTVTQAALFIGVAPTTLYGWYENDRGPRGFKIGGRIFYMRSDLNSWTEEQVRSTSRGGVKAS